MPPFVTGQLPSAADWNNLFATFFPAGGVSAYSGTLLSGTNQSAWLTGLGIPNITGLGLPNGIATLDGNAMLSPSQIPTKAIGNFSVAGPLPWIDVVAYGAVGNDSTDNSSAFTNAIASLPATGGAIYFPPGIYRVSGTINIPHSGVRLFGAGSGSSVIRTTSAANDILVFGDGTNPYTSCSASGLGFASSVTRTAGTAVSFKNITGGGLTDIAITAAGHGILLSACATIFISNTTIQDPIASTGIGILISGSASTRFYFGNLFIFTSSSQCLYGIQMLSCDGLLMDNCVMAGTGYGMIINPTSGNTVKNISLNNSVITGCANDGLSVNPAAGGFAIDLRFDGLRSATNTGNGASIGSTGTVNSVQFTGSKIIDNGTNGISVGGGVGVAVRTSHIGGNSVTSSNTSSGIAVAAGVTKFDFVGNRSGTSPTHPSAIQKYGISIATGSSDSYTVIGNDVADNVTQGISDGGTGTNKQLIGNYPSVGETRAEIGGSLRLRNYGAGLLQTDSSGNVFAAAQGIAFAATRQTVLSGPQTSGAPVFFPATSGTLLLTTVSVTSGAPLIVSAAFGSTNLGQFDLIGNSTGNIAFSCTASNINYLYVRVNGDGTITPNVTILRPIYQRGGTPSTTAGQFTFNIGEMAGYLGDGVNANQDTIVFIGECVAGSSTITSTTAYAYAGFFKAALINTLPGLSTSVLFTHAIGTFPQARPLLFFQCLTAQAGYVTGDVITDVSFNGQPVTFLSNTIAGGFATGTANGFQVIPRGGGASVVLTASNWAYAMIFSRGW